MTTYSCPYCGAEVPIGPHEDCPARHLPARGEAAREQIRGGIEELLAWQRDRHAHLIETLAAMEGREYVRRALLGAAMEIRRQRS
jgi:hypothetical protein